MIKRWEKKENRDAKAFNSKGTPGSGNQWFAKGDSKSDKFLIENKTTDKENFTIQGTVWDKIYRESILNNRTPVLSVEFGTKKVREVVVLDLNDFLEICQELEAYDKMF